MFCLTKTRAALLHFLSNHQKPKEERETIQQFSFINNYLLEHNSAYEIDNKENTD